MANRINNRLVLPKKLGPGVWLLDRIGLFNCYPYRSYRIYVAVLTFICYAAYHMSRKPFSVVANVLAPNCSLTDEGLDNDTVSVYTNSTSGWPPFNGPRCKTLISALGYSWLFTYAIFTFASGYVADRVNVRYFLTLGMFGCGVFVGLLGVAYYAEVHHIAYFIIVQMFIGVFESTGWPGVVAVMGNWFGKKNRGLFLGIWNAHTSVGNILGTAIPSIWAVPGQAWAWSFFVPAFVMFFVGVMMFLFLVVDPSHVGLPPPQHHLEKKYKSNNKIQFCDQNEPSHLNGSSKEVEHETSMNEECLTNIEMQSKMHNGQSHNTEGLRSKSLSESDVNESDDDHNTEGLRSKSPSKSDDDHNTEGLRSKSPSKSDDDHNTKGLRSKSPLKSDIDESDDDHRALLRTSNTEELRNESPSNRNADESKAKVQQELEGKKSAISLFQAFKLPGVLEYSIALFFAKLVVYTFLFWLPYYIAFNPITGNLIGEQKADLLATLYDVGGIIGGIVTGAMSDLLSARATSSIIMMYLAVPTLFLFRSFGHQSVQVSIVLILFCGAFINGPYTLITTAVSNDLGTHKSLGNNLKAKATVGAIIDGFGSLGAATGPLITGWVSDDFGWDHAFYVLMASCFISSLMLTRLLLSELKYFYYRIKGKRSRLADDQQILLTDVREKTTDLM